MIATFHQDTTFIVGIPIYMPKDVVISSPKRTQVFICHGKPCSKNKKRLNKLTLLFPMARKTKCMGVCKGPVVLVVKDKKQYFCKNIKKKKHRTRLWEFVNFDIQKTKLRYKLKRSKGK
jgi:hypothetical protein